MARVLRWVFDTLFALLTNRRVEGMQNLPPQGPYLLVANHLSVFDVPLLYGLMGNENVTGWAAKKWEKHPIYGTVVRMGGGIFIRRGEVDRQALSQAVRWLKAGKIFGMAPEGTRSRTGVLARAKVGAAYLAHLADVPLVPVGIAGTETIGHMLSRLKRPQIGIHFGEAFRLPPVDVKQRAVGLRSNTDEIMCRIAALLPPEYRGVYANHPRLQELLANAVD